MERNMDFFMQETNAIEEIEIEGIAKYVYPKGHEHEGKPVPWVLKPVSTQHFRGITDSNKKKIKKKGKIETIVDEERITLELMVDTIVYPDFKNSQWLAKEGLIDPCDLMQKVLDFPGDFKRISLEVVDVNGMGTTDNASDEELVEEVKN